MRKPASQMIVIGVTLLFVTVNMAMGLVAAGYLLSGGKRVWLPDFEAKAQPEEMAVARDQEARAAAFGCTVACSSPARPEQQRSGAVP